MKRLFIQLARFGDLMQTAPLVASANEADPTGEVHLLVDESLVGLAALIKSVTAVHSIDRNNLFKEIAGERLGEATGRLRELARELCHYEFDQVVNLTHTPESAYLAALAGGKEIRGLAGGRKGVYSVDNWSRLFRAGLTRRDCGSFHLVDFHLRLAGLQRPVSEVWLKAPPPSLDLPSGKPIIVVQLGANSPLRQWPVESFVEAVEIAANRFPGLTPVLVGSNSERELGEKFSALSHIETIDLTGKTDLPTLAAVVSKAALILGGDTGTLHLAAALGIPTVSIFLGMARPDDTAPYQKGSVIFEPLTECHPCAENHRCAHLNCHRDVAPEVVAEAIVATIQGKKKLDPAAGQTYRRRITTFDENGCLALRDQTSTLPSAQRAALRDLWRFEFDATSRSSVDDPVDLFPSIEEAPPLPADTKELLVIIDRLTPRTDIIGLLAHLAQLELENLPSDRQAAFSRIESTVIAFQRRFSLLSTRKLRVAV